jgi:hypothetical protein
MPPAIAVVAAVSMSPTKMFNFFISFEINLKKIGCKGNGIVLYFAVKANSLNKH